ncbi:unnamed protein product [Chondrus crispus]|uniref:Uncharacterized protein n=1 Tax=Chondrus crispus TaxID=2769 RepID=R7QLQ8_CHOCR|nr:unnamed protein product [Chondrus crispus]CDF39437.1 unnamed protein product [Chondrus crispus]|eukprot:XP_005719348.1 unnamed protein product [Chondrus crispus]
MNQLNPTLKKKNWTAYEDRTILRLHATLGNKWSAIAQVLPGRTDNSVKNRYNSTLKRAIKERGLTPNNFHIDRFVENLHARHFAVPSSFHHPHLRPMEEQPQHIIPTRVCATPDPHIHAASPHYLDPFRIKIENQGSRLVDQTSHAWARKRAHYGLDFHQTNLAADVPPAPQYAGQSGERLPTFQEMLENSAPLEPNRLQRLAAQDVRESSPCTLTHAALPPHDAPTPTTAALDDRGTQRRILYPTENLAPSRDVLSPSKSIAKRRHGRTWHFASAGDGADF